MRVVVDGVDPIAWNFGIDRERTVGVAVPRWPAVRVLGAYGTESLYVFPSRLASPTLVAAWPRQDRAAHWVRMYPRYRWIVIEQPVDSAAAEKGLGLDSGGSDDASKRLARFFGANGSLLWETRAGSVPMAIGRDLVLALRPSTVDTIPPRLSVLQLPGGEPRASWPGLKGWGASSPLENFLAVNTIGVFDPETGQRQDELRLLDLEGTILWARTIPADWREFAVSNFGDVAIARDQRLVVFDRYGSEKLRVTLPRNSVGRTAITPDGRYALVATSSPVAKHKGGGLWVALYETTRKTPVWSRRNLPPEGTKLADVLEMSVSDDGQRALLRLTTGTVLLLGSDGRKLASWELERMSRGEYDPGFVPRRTWLSSDGTYLAFTTPVARSLAEARGWLYHVPR